MIKWKLVAIKNEKNHRLGIDKIVRDNAKLIKKRLLFITKDNFKIVVFLIDNVLPLIFILLLFLSRFILLIAFFVIIF